MMAYGFPRGGTLGTRQATQASLGFARRLRGMRGLHGTTLGFARRLCGVRSLHSTTLGFARRLRGVRGLHGTMDARRALGLPANASAVEVKEAWRAFAKQWHPDLHPAGDARQEAEERFKLVHQAVHEDPTATMDPSAAAAHAPSPTGYAMDAPDVRSSHYVRRRARPASAAERSRAAGESAGVHGDPSAGVKITVGLTLFTMFCFWAKLAWFTEQSDDSRRSMQARSTVSWGEQHAFGIARAPPRRAAGHR